MPCRPTPRQRPRIVKDLLSELLLPMHLLHHLPKSDVCVDELDMLTQGLASNHAKIAEAQLSVYM